MDTYTIEQQAAISDIIFMMYDDEMFTAKQLSNLLADLGYNLSPKEVLKEYQARI